MEPDTAPAFPLLPLEYTIKGLTDAEAEVMWIKLRWPEGIKCPQCGSSNLYDISRSHGYRRWKCKEDDHRFTLTSGTPFAYQKVPLRTVLLIISTVQHSKGDMVIRRLALELGINGRPAYMMVGKAHEMLTAGIERRSLWVGYGSAKINRAREVEAPRAQIATLLDKKTCTECHIEKTGDNFQGRAGLAADWGLTSAVCKECRSTKIGKGRKDTWRAYKETDSVTPVIERAAADLIAKPKWIGGMLFSTHSYWSAQDRQDLSTLAAANVPPATAAIALGRSAKSLAWRARDILPHADMPATWRRLITPSRITVPAQPRLMVYPYLPNISRIAEVSGANLTMQVAALVARSYPDFMRADICQTVLLALLEEKTTLADLKSPEVLRAFVRQYRRNQESLPGVGGSMRDSRSSLDAPLWDEDAGDAYGSTMPSGVMNRLEW